LSSHGWDPDTDPDNLSRRTLFDIRWLSIIMPPFTAPSKNIFTSQLARGRICSECARRDHPQSETCSALTHDLQPSEQDSEFPHKSQHCNKHRPSTTITGLHVHQTAPPVIFHSSWLLRRWGEESGIRMLNHACDSFTLRGASAIYEVLSVDSPPNPLIACNRPSSRLLLGYGKGVTRPRQR
jgi:hypothetical protein